MELFEKSGNIFNDNLSLGNNQTANISIENTKKIKQISYIQRKSAINAIISKIGKLITFVCICTGALVANKFGFIAFFGFLHLITSVLSIYLLSKIFKIKLEEAKNKQRSKIPIYSFFAPLFIANVLFTCSIFFKAPLILVIASSLAIFVSMINMVRVIKEYVGHKKLSKEIDKKAIIRLCVDIAYSVLNICLLSLVVASFFVLPTLPMQIALLTVLIMTIGLDLVNIVDNYKTSKSSLNNETNDLKYCEPIIIFQDIGIDDLQSYNDQLYSEEGLSSEEIKTEEIVLEELNDDGEKKMPSNGGKKSDAKDELPTIIDNATSGDNLLISSDKKII